MTGDLSIGELARRAGIQTSAIRYYESIGLLPPPERVNGRRRYDEDVFQRLGMILRARQVGFRVSELQVLFGEAPGDAPVSERWQRLAVEKAAEMEVQIAHSQAVRAWLIESLDKCECVEPGDCAVVTFDDVGNVQLEKKRE
jgi:MerR family transcriptional regulator, redox-sensitive transcriptional activator SoxR